MNCFVIKRIPSHTYYTTQYNERRSIVAFKRWVDAKRLSSVIEQTNPNSKKIKLVIEKIDPVNLSMTCKLTGMDWCILNKNGDNVNDEYEEWLYYKDHVQTYFEYLYNGYDGDYKHSLLRLKHY
jgi:hypothetical protein